jgi:hypothetical protein
MSTSPILPNSRIYGPAPTIKLTDVVNIDNTIIDPRTPTTLVDDGGIPLTVTMPGIEEPLTKKIKLINNIGASIITISGTVMLDSGLTEVDLIYNTTYGMWVANTPGAVIPATQKRSFIVSSGAVASARNIGFVDQGNKNSLAISLNGQVLASGGPGFGTEVDNTGTGVIWVYNRDGFDWVETDLITSNALDGQIFLGKSTATNKDGSIIAGGAPDYASVPSAPANNGAVLVFEKQADGKYGETSPAVGTDLAIIPVPPTVPGINVDPDNQLRIGECIKMSGDGNTLVIGMDVGAGVDFAVGGFVWIYTRNPSTTKWSLLQVLDTRTFIGDRFGDVVDISADSNTIVVGVPLYGAGDFAGNGPGGVQTFNKAILSTTQVSTITFNGVTDTIDGKYFVFEGLNSGIDPARRFFYVWYQQSGGAIDPATDPAIVPAIADATGIEVDITAVVFPNDAAVALATLNAINSNITAGNYVEADLTTPTDMTITNISVGSVNATADGYDGENFSTGLTFETTTWGAVAGEYTKSANDVIGSGSDDTEQLGLDVAINAIGTVMIAQSGDYTRFYSRATTTDNWTEDITLLSGYLGGWGSRELMNVDINSAGNVAIVGNPYYNSSVGAIFILTNNGSGWYLKSGPTTYQDVLEPAVAAVSSAVAFGSDATISGSGNNAIIGGWQMRDSRLGVGYVYDIDTTGVAAASSSYFIITSPRDGSPAFLYVVWYKTTDSSTPPNKAAYPFGSLLVGSYELSVDVRGLDLPAQNSTLVFRTVQAINGNSTFSAVVSAASNNQIITISSKFSGTTTFPVSDGAVPTNFVFTKTTAGEDPPLTGAFWPFA